MGYALLPPLSSNVRHHKESIVEAAIWGLVGTVVGAMTSMGTTWLAARSSSTLQTTKTREERAERANAFQRQTLLDLQESIHDAIRLVHRAHIEDCLAHRETKKWGTNNLTTEVNEGIRLAQRKVSLLVERVSDDPLRAEIKTLMSTTMQVLLASSEREAQFHLEKTSANANQSLEKVGTVLRQHY